MEKAKKIKLGLCLGSGGAKGLAHVGAIKVFEEEGLKFDLVAGTSIGSIVGALYAKGYSSDDMLSLLQEVSFADAQFTIAMALGMVSLTDIISKFIGGAHFEDLKIPFRAVAVDAERGKEVIFSKGDLAIALASSSAIPPFRPIEHEGKILVDGAYLNYVPADVVKDMGADFVLSINLGEGKDTNQGIKSILDDTFPENKIPYANRSWQCYEYSNYVLHPQLSQYSTSSLKNLDEIYKIGYDCAKSQIKDILNAIKN